MSPEVKDPIVIEFSDLGVDASYTTATITGKVSEVVKETGFVYGIVYSETQNPEVTAEGLAPEFFEPADDKTFTVDLEDLTEGTTYHYRTFTRENTVYSYGEDMTFTTKAFPVAEIASTEILNDAIKVTFKSGLSLKEGYEIGLEYSTSADFSGAKTRVLTSNDYDEQVNLYVVRDINLLMFSTVYCRPYVKELQTGEVRRYSDGDPQSSTVTMDLNYVDVTTEGDPFWGTPGEHYTGFEASFPGSSDGFSPVKAGFSYGTLVSTKNEFDITTEGVTEYSMTQAYKKGDTSALPPICYYTATLTDLTSGTYYRGYVKYNDEVIAYTEIKQLSL